MSAVSVVGAAGDLREEAAHHGVAGARGVDEPDLGGRHHVLGAVLVEQQRAVAAAGDDDVARAGVLELVRVGHALLGLLDLHAKDASDLVVVGLDQEGVRLEGLHQELAGRVNHELDAATRRGDA